MYGALTSTEPSNDDTVAKKKGTKNRFVIHETDDESRAYW